MGTCVGKVGVKDGINVGVVGTLVTTGTVGKLVVAIGEVGAMLVCEGEDVGSSELGDMEGTEGKAVGLSEGVAECSNKLI